MPSLRRPAIEWGERSSPRSSNRPTRRTSESHWLASAHASASPSAPPPTIAVRQPALARPASHQHEQSLAKQQQRKEADHVKAAQPDARELIAGLGEEGDTDGNEEHHRPRGCEAEILLLVTAESLDLVDIGDLKGQQGEHRHAGDRAEVPPFEAVSGHHIAAIDGEADEPDQRELDHPNGAGEHDGRVGRGQPLVRSLLGRCGQLTRHRHATRSGSRGLRVPDAEHIELGHRRAHSWRKRNRPAALFD